MSKKGTRIGWFGRVTCLPAFSTKIFLFVSPNGRDVQIDSKYLWISQLYSTPLRACGGIFAEIKFFICEKSPKWGPLIIPDSELLDSADRWDIGSHVTGPYLSSVGITFGKAVK